MKAQAECLLYIHVLPSAEGMLPDRTPELATTERISTATQSILRQSTVPDPSDLPHGHPPGDRPQNAVEQCRSAATPPGDVQSAHDVFTLTGVRSVDTRCHRHPCS